MRMRMYMFSHAHADSTWTPRTQPFTWTPRTPECTMFHTEPFVTIRIKPERSLRTHAYRATSTLDLTSTNASPLRTRPACQSPSLRESWPA